MKNINLEVKPREEMTWEEFKEKTPKYSIALDGFVKAGPMYDGATLHLNMDHHVDVFRLATMSTSQQALMHVNVGLMNLFETGSNSKPNVYINDTDGDTALATFILEYHHNKQLINSAELEQLVSNDAKLDITGGTYPLNHSSEIMSKHRWVFEPYTNLRKSGQLSNADESTMRKNIEDVHNRILIYLMGDAKQVELDKRYELFYKGSQFWMAHEIGGQDARYTLVSEGMTAFINLVAERPDGRKVYSIGKNSRYNPFPIEHICSALTKLEGLPANEGWGGSDIIGGSSRKHGSGLEWNQIQDRVQQLLNTGW